MDSFGSPTSSHRAPDDIPSSLPPQSATGTPPPRPPTSSSIYNLFLTAVGRTPRGVDTFSPAGPDEEEFWSAYDDGEDPGASSRTPLCQSPTPAATSTTTTSTTAASANTTVVGVAQAGGGVVARQASSAVGVVPSPSRLTAHGSTAGGVNGDGDGGNGRPRSVSRALQVPAAAAGAGVDAGRYSSGRGGPDDGLGGDGGYSGSINRRRRRMFRAAGAAVSESGVYYI